MNALVVIGEWCWIVARSTRQRTRPEVVLSVVVPLLASSVPREASGRRVVLPRRATNVAANATRGRPVSHGPAVCELSAKRGIVKESGAGASRDQRGSERDQRSSCQSWSRCCELSAKRGIEKESSSGSPRDQRGSERDQRSSCQSWSHGFRAQCQERRPAAVCCLLLRCAQSCV
jgi:hypothetical protein